MVNRVWYKLLDFAETTLYTVGWGLMIFSALVLTAMFAAVVFLLFATWIVALWRML